MNELLIYLSILLPILVIGTILYDWFVIPKKTNQLVVNYKRKQETFIVSNLSSSGIFSSSVLAIASWVMNNHSDPVDEESVRETGKEIAQNPVYLHISKNILS